MEKILELTLAQIYNNPQGSLFSIACIFFRVIGFVRLLPFLCSDIKINTVRNGIIFSLTTMFFIYIQSRGGILVLQNFDFWTIVVHGIKEFLLGFILSYFLYMPFAISDSAGSLMSSTMGSSSMMHGVSLSKDGGSAIGSLITNLLVLHVLIYPDILLPILELLKETFVKFPLGFHPFTDGGIVYEDLIGIISLLNDAVILSTKVASPAIMISLVSDLAFSLVNRLTPQIQITFLSAPIKSTISVIALYPTWKLFFNVLDKHILVFSDKFYDFFIA